LASAFACGGRRAARPEAHHCKPQDETAATAARHEWWERITRPWREGPFADLPLSLLRRDQLADVILGRAAVAAKAARDEPYGLKATLRYALVFPTKTGRPWCYGDFHKLVWSKATRRAASRWREGRGLGEDAPTPFDELEPQDLRSTAATLMRDAGFAREEAAARLGHADSGAVLDRIYDQDDRRARMRKAIEQRAPRGLERR
jgi:hypothetical protein